MALTSLTRQICWPGPAWVSLAATVTLDHANDYVGAVFISPVSDTVTEIHFRTGTVTSAQSLTIGIFTVDATNGGPNTLVGSSGAVASPAATTTYNVSVSAALTQGTKYCIKIAYTGTAGTLQIVSRGISLWASGSAFPYNISSVDNSGTLVKTGNLRETPFSLVFGSTFYPIPGIGGVHTAGSTTIRSDSTVAAGNRFQVPVQMSASGIWVMCTQANSSAMVFELYADATAAGGTPLATCSQDEDITQSNTAEEGMYLFDGGEYTLQASTWYRVVARATAAISSTLNTATNFPSSSHLLYGANCYYTAYASGSWTDTNTSLAAIGLLIGKVHDGTGSGGVAANPVAGFIS